MRARLLEENQSIISKQQQHTLQGKLVELRGVPGQLQGSAGKTIAQGTSVGRPHSSWPMKLPNRPRPRPNRYQRSDKIHQRAKNDLLFARKQVHGKPTHPESHRGKDIPPSHTRNSQVGSLARRSPP